MYIAPNTNIRILKNVPLDTTYEHTIYFDSASAQTTYFQGLTKYTLTAQSYQRVKRGYIRVNLVADNLYDCNYLMFQNSSFGSKWFYAFIKTVEYINNSVAEIEFVLDVMQTWAFDYTLKECFVEREHSATDNLFENLVEENVDLGDDYTVASQTHFDMSDMRVCILAKLGQEGTSGRGKTINGIYTPLYISGGLRVNVADDVAQLNTMIQKYVDAGKEDDIVAIFQYPAWMGDISSVSSIAEQWINVGANTDFLDNYRPRNKKLYTYPYNFIVLSNNAGQSAVFKYENFTDSSNIIFNIAGTVVSVPSTLCYPINYRGIANDYDSGVAISNFPQNAWVGDTYKAWLAQNRASTQQNIQNSIRNAAVGIGTTATGLFLSATGVGATMGAPLLAGGAIATYSSGVSIYNQIKSLEAQKKDLENTPPQLHGQGLSDSLNCGLHRVKYSFYKMTIKAQFARIIDDYFDRFGYAIHRNKVPNRKVRPHWTYTKTIGCTISGSVPSDDMASICHIYDNGITFWVNGSEVGNYSLDNTV